LTKGKKSTAGKRYLAVLVQDLGGNHWGRGEEEDSRKRKGEKVELMPGLRLVVDFFFIHLKIFYVGDKAGGKGGGGKRKKRLEEEKGYGSKTLTISALTSTRLEGKGRGEGEGGGRKGAKSLEKRKGRGKGREGEEKRRRINRV